MDYLETIKTSQQIQKLNKKVDSSENSYNFTNKMYLECRNELDLCKNKLKGVLNSQNKIEITDDIDIYTAKDYYPN